MSNNKPTNNADERTPLVTTNGASSAHVARHNTNGSDYDSRSPTLVFLFDKSKTPGLDSDSIAVRSLVYTWHVTKVTLLSSMSLAIPFETRRTAARWKARRPRWNRRRRRRFYP
jgi:hypothetical protein